MYRTDPPDHQLEEVHEICDRVWMRLQVRILQESIECQLWLELGERDGWVAAEHRIVERCWAVERCWVLEEMRLQGGAL